MKGVYRNKLRSRALIREAVITLLEKKGNMSEISVSDVVKTANINRGTFYNNYNNIQEVLNEFKTERINAFMQELKKVNSIKDLNWFIKTLVWHFKLNEESYKKIVNGVSSSMVDDLKNEFIKQVLQNNTKINAFNFSFVVNALSGMYVDYLKNLSNFSIEEIGEKSINIISKIFV